MDYGREPKIYLMPRCFGPAGGPRQAPNDVDFSHGPSRFTRYLVGFQGRASEVGALLPKGLELRGEPTVFVQFFELAEIPWLAGRGYNILSVIIPVRHRSGTGGDVVDGLFQAVLWENLCDPIVTGREQLGHAKLYAQLPPARRWGNTTSIRASWEGFTFAEMEVSCGSEPDQQAIADLQSQAGAGLISHKYIPRSGDWAVADADYLTLTPLPGASNLADPQPQPLVRVGDGQIRFNRPTWQDMPTQYHIIQRLADLEQISPMRAVVMEGKTYADAFDQHILA
ncbi:acetoacetate decarboxylase family protein [Novosphingobium sp. Gsoil 351]|uniref:acetoacetate decarboxylase family protein n=1 Tax=Novosphingobium sp. Gsoil 351 TaxID=2675225 RepID=UPI0012B4AF9D|nr:acetoacetate decarboxylase family protein [Novosphingobium sp. Gsoil 351]QGN55029.1 hypothetical protein GKE62_11140 [Novosphingobium sp. Gsoil 351]